MENREYTHGGSFFKNIWLLFRSILNIAAFAGLICLYLLWMEQRNAANPLFVPIVLLLTALCLLGNLILPLITRRK